MTAAFDPRIVKLGIELDNGINYFEDLYINAKGTRYMGAIPNECEAIVYNLTGEQRNYLLTQTSPFNQNRTAKLMTLDVGRQSYGTFRLYQGNVIAATPTQPPDIGVILRGLTGAFQLGNIIPINQPRLSKLSTISGAVANAIGDTLDFQATDKNISNYSYTGAALNHVAKLGETGQVDAYSDNGTLTVKDQGQPVTPEPFLIDADNGMVGIPEADERGVHVKVMLNPAIRLGGSVTIRSKLNPAVNGTYKNVYQMNFEVATREDAFWYDLYVTNYVLGGS